jgi:hypothetical protein
MSYVIERDVLGRNGAAFAHIPLMIGVEGMKNK